MKGKPTKLPFLLVSIILTIFMIVVALSSCVGMTTKTITATAVTNETTNITATITGMTTVTITATDTIQVNGALDTLEPASFTVSDLILDPFFISPGTQFSVSVTVTNTGGSRGTYDAVLDIEGMGTFTKSVTLDASNSKVIMFTLTDAPDEGRYDLKVGNISTDLYTG